MKSFRGGAGAGTTIDRVRELLNEAEQAVHLQEMVELVGGEGESEAGEPAEVRRLAEENLLLGPVVDDPSLVAEAVALLRRAADRLEDAALG